MYLLLKKIELTAYNEVSLIEIAPPSKLALLEENLTLERLNELSSQYIAPPVCDCK